MRGIFGSSIPSSPHVHFDFLRWIMRIVFALAAATATPAGAQNLIFVTDAGAATPSTCNLAQAIGLANYANFIDAASIGSATTNFGACQALPPSFPPAPGSYTLLVIPTQITLTTIDNYWYGPNALPPIASVISIVPTAGALTLTASHVGDPTPATANAFRFLYVSGGLEIQAGSLTLQYTILQGGYAKGGDAGSGGGGAGMGGAIFNQGSLNLASMSLIGNAAQGGSTANNTTGGGGMGQDGTYNNYGYGGGFGWASTPSGVGGKGGVGNSNGGGGGGGFIAGSDGGNGGVGTGGGKGGLGNAGPSAGDGGSAFIGPLVGTCNGGDFGSGGVCASGGGVGGGGGAFGGGGFGGGGGEQFSGGFGGGGGRLGAAGGFGGGYGLDTSGGGAGLGGAIFNHAGTVYLLNVTATGNMAKGGTGYAAGSGLGAALFNLNGTVTIDFSTLAGNFLSGNNGAGDNNGPEDATVYSLAYGNKIQDGTASSASLTIHNSIIHGTHADGGAGNDILVNVVDGAHANSSSVVYKGKNFVQFSTNLGSVTQTGSSPTQADPLLGALSVYSASPLQLPVLPIGSNSPANDATSSCLQADNSTPLTYDERGVTRPYGSQCDVGAYEFDSDYIFADGAEVKL